MNIVEVRFEFEDELIEGFNEFFLALNGFWCKFNAQIGRISVVSSEV